MKFVYLLMRRFNDGCDYSKDVVGAYLTEETANSARNSWMEGAGEYETFFVKEMALHA